MKKLLLFLLFLSSCSFDPFPALATSTNIRDVTNDYFLKINSDGSINIGGSVLPTGAATAANQLTQIANELTLIANQTNGTQVTQATQKGVWSTGRTWSLLNTTDSVNSVQSGVWTTGRTWSLLNKTDSIEAFQSSGSNFHVDVDLSAPSQGRASVSTFTQDYGSSGLSTGSFTTIISSTASQINEEDIFDSSGEDFYLAWASNCGSLSTSTNAIIVSPGGGGKDFLIPSGSCVGFEAKTANITLGFVNITFYK
jgi:hypothetical protein